MNRLGTLILTFATLITSVASAGGLEELRTSDVIFQESTSSQSAALKRATGSRYTHVGLVVLRDGEPWVLEAVQPVRWTRLAAWVSRGVDEHAVVKRMAAPLTEQAATRTAAAAEVHLGKSYDLQFGWSDDRMYCSELVYKAYRDGAGVELTPTRSHADYDLSDPAVARAARERYPEGIPRDEPVVAPSDLLDSPLLIEVRRVP